MEEKNLKRPPMWIWLVSGICIGLALCGGIIWFAISDDGNRDDVSNSHKEQFLARENLHKDTVVVVEREMVKEVPADKASVVKSATDEWLGDGRFYGNVGGYGIHGSMTFTSRNPKGYVYYDSQGPTHQLNIYEDGNVWNEYDGDTPTGRWEIQHRNYHDKKFMTGRYVRLRDGKTFNFELFRQE